MNQYKSQNFIDKDENIAIRKHLSNKNEKEHTHDFIEMEYIWCGSGYQVINGISYYVERGDLLFFNFGDKHSYSTSHEIGILDVLINPHFLSDELVNSENAFDILTLTSFKDFSGITNHMLPKIKFLGKDLIEIEALLEFMQNEFLEKNPGYMPVLKSYVNILLMKVFRVIKKSDSINLYCHFNKIAPEVLKYIEDNYDKKISLKELAKISFYNPSYFSTVFKECFGKTLTKYIHEKRMNTAIKMINETSYNIDEISSRLGYSNKKQFYKLFKEFTGLTPNAYRTKYRT